MKKLIFSTLLFGIFSLTSSAQRKKAMSDWEAGIDAVTNEQQVKDILFYFGGNDTVTVDSKPFFVTVEKHKPINNENRVLILPGTPGRIVDIQYVTADSILDPNAEAGTDKYIFFKKKVYFVQFEKPDGKALATLPFEVGAHPGETTPFALPVKTSFTYKKHFYEMAVGSATLQVPTKFLVGFRIASGYKF